MKKISRVLEMAYGNPLLILPSTFQSLHTVLMRRLSGDSSFEVLTEFFDDEDEDKEDDKMILVDNGVAQINIDGVIGNHLSFFEKACLGGVDLRDIDAALEVSIEDPAVESILLYINSPGGTADYVEQVAMSIKEAGKKKKIVAYTPDIMASAAMWLAAGADEIYAHPGATAIGSIGVYSVFLDSSVEFANEGLKWEIFSAGKYKTEGMGGTSLSEEFKTLVQQDVDKLYDKFTSWIVDNRPDVEESTMQGLVYDANQALELGLIDAIIKDPADIFVE